jgi:hypothetical protein
MLKIKIKIHHISKSMTTSRDLFYFRLQSKDAFDNGGKWVHNGDFSVDLHRNPIFARGIIGYKLDAVSIPNTNPNVPEGSNQFKWTDLGAGGFPSSDIPLVSTEPFNIELRRVSNTSVREVFSVDPTSVGPSNTSRGYLNDIQGIMGGISLAGTDFEDLGSSLFDLIGLDYDQGSFDPNVGPNSSTSYYFKFFSKSSEVSFRFPSQNPHLQQDLFFTDQTQNLNFTQSKISTQAPFVWTVNIPAGQYSDNELLGDGEPGTANFGVLGDAIRAVDALGDWKFVQLEKQNFVPPSEKWSLVRRAGDVGGIVVYSTGQGSELGKLIGFHVPQISPNASKSTTDTITAESLSNLSGTQMFYLESNLAGGVVSVNGEGQSNSMIAAVPVNVPFGAIQTRVWDTHNYSIIYPEPKAFSQVTLTLKDQDGRILDPGASEVVLAVQILPWRQC